MATKYYLLDKDGNKVDNVLRTKDELREKVNEIMQKEQCGWDVINKNYDYQEVSDGGVSTEENTSAKTASAGSNASGDNEFKSKEDKSGEYKFSSENDISTPTIGTDEKGWNAIIGQLDSLPPDVASEVEKYKKYLEIKKVDSGVASMQKNAIRVLYLYNNFINFDKYCGETFPPAVTGYLRQGTAWLKMTQTEHAFNTIKEDMADIIPQMLEELKKYFDGNDQNDAREEFYDEVKDFDEEIQNLLFGIRALDEKQIASTSTFSSYSDSSNVSRKTKLAQTMASDNEDFNQFCKGTPSGKALSDYIMNIAVNKFHLGRVQMNASDPNSTMDYWNPEESEVKNVRVSNDINDYLDLQHTKIFGLKSTNLMNDATKKEFDDIIQQFNKGKLSQKDAQTKINQLVTNTRNKIIESIKLFFDFMGITNKHIMNQFMSGLKRLDETEYKQNWSKLVANYKTTLGHKITMYKEAHSNDMTAEDRDSCLKELDNLLTNADQMAEAVKNGDSDKLLADSQEISTVLERVQKKTAEAKKNFKAA